MQHAVKLSPMDVVQEYFGGKNCSPCARATGQGNHFEFIPTVSMESQHSTGVPTCHDFPRFVIVSEKSIPEVGNREFRSSQNWGFWGKNTPYGQIFTNVQKPQQTSRKHVFWCKFREIWPTGSRWNRALFNGQKKTKFRLFLPKPLLRGLRPKFVRDSPKPLTRSSPNFIQIRSLPAEL